MLPGIEQGNQVTNLLKPCKGKDEDLSKRLSPLSVLSCMDATRKFHGLVKKARVYGQIKVEA